MPDTEPAGGATPGESPDADTTPEAPRPRRRATKKAAPAAGEPTPGTADGEIGAAVESAVANQVATKVVKRVRKAADPAKKAARAAKATKAAEPTPATEEAVEPTPATEEVAEPTPPAALIDPASGPTAELSASVQAPVEEAAEPTMRAPRRVARRPAAPPAVAFIAPEPQAEPPPAPTEAPRRATGRTAAAPTAVSAPVEGDTQSPTATTGDTGTDRAADSAAGPETELDEAADGDRPQRRRGRRGRGRGRGAEAAGDGTETAELPSDEATSTSSTPTTAATPASDAGTVDAPREQSDTGEAADDADESASTRRRRRRRRRTGTEADTEDTTVADPPNTVVRERKTRPRGRDTDDEVQGVKGSVRLEAKRQRRRDGRDQSRRRPPIITEAEFLARREAVDRVMVVRQVADRTQIAVLEDGVLVEHYVTKASATAYAGNVYLGKVQNVLSSMEAAFVDIGKSRNAVLYAGEVNWDAAGMEGKARRIEDALKSGHSVLCQVTKDPVGQKGARLTSQISLPGRFLVYVPEGSMTGISRKLPDTERKRLKDILKQLVPDEAGVIIRTAAEGASEEELTRDVQRLQAQWEAIQAKAAKASAPALLYGEPDLVIRVVRDIFNEDFTSLVVSGDAAWEMVEEYVTHVSPDLADRLSRHTSERDVFAELRIDEQLAKGLDRKVYLPSGGSLVIDRTEAMTVVDVNTGKFIGKGGNLEETVTRNNLEAAEEIVRQLRLRDIGGMIVIDFIDMILESNRDLVLRRLTECLGRDRTKHQVAEVTSLGLVQMTRKRVGQGLLEAFSEPCETCKGRGLIVHMEPVEHSTTAEQRHEMSEPLVRRRRNQGPPAGLEVVAAATSRAALPPPVVVESPPDGVLTEPVVADEPAGGLLPEAPAGQPAPEGLPGQPDAEPAPELASELATELAPELAAELAPEPNGSGPTERAEPGPVPARRRPRRTASRPAGPPSDAAASVPVR